MIVHVLMVLFIPISLNGELKFGKSCEICTLVEKSRITYQWVNRFLSPTSSQLFCEYSMPNSLRNSLRNSPLPTQRSPWSCVLSVCFIVSPIVVAVPDAFRKCYQKSTWLSSQTLIKPHPSTTGWMWTLVGLG